MMIRRIFLLLAFMPLLASAQNQILPPIGGGSGGGVTQQAVTDTLNKNIPRNSTSIDTTNRLLPGWKGQTVTTPGAITMTDGSLTASIGNVTSVAGMVQGYQGVFDSTLIKCGTDMSKQSTASIGAYGSQTNISVSIAPKGTGAFYLGPKADGTATGGNVRGAGAVDLQQYRLQNTDVASGDYSFAGGGRAKATGSNSFSFGLVSGTSGLCSFAAGYNVSANKDAAVCFGSINGSSGWSSFVAGERNYADGRQSTLFGYYGYAGFPSEFCVGQQGAMYKVLQLQDTTGGAATDTLTFRYTSDSSGLAPRVWTVDNCMKIDSGKIWTYTAQITSRSDVGDASSFEIKGGIQRVGATTSMVGSPTITTLGATAGAATWAVNAVADDTNDALFILVTGSAAKYVKWTCAVTLTQGGF